MAGLYNTPFINHNRVDWQALASGTGIFLPENVMGVALPSIEMILPSFASRTNRTGERAVSRQVPRRIVQGEESHESRRYVRWQMDELDDYRSHAGYNERLFDEHGTELPSMYGALGFCPDLIECYEGPIPDGILCLLSAMMHGFTHFKV